MTDKKFDKRALAALVALISGFALPFTGLAVHLLHDSSLEGPRLFWVAAHEALGIAFTAATVWHIALNRKALARHISGTGWRIAGLGREAVCAAALVGMVLFAAVGHIWMAH